MKFITSSMLNIKNIINIKNYVISNIKSKLNFKEPKKILGRWNIDYCDKKMDKKVDLSNEDHCGPCGNYILSKKLKT
jgi:hypothetical protein